MPNSVHPTFSGYIYNPHSDSCIRKVDTVVEQARAKSDCELAGEQLMELQTAETLTWFRNLRTLVTGEPRLSFFNIAGTKTCVQFDLGMLLFIVCCYLDSNKRWIGLIQNSSSGTWLWNGNTMNPLTP